MDEIKNEEIQEEVPVEEEAKETAEAEEETTTSEETKEEAEATTEEVDDGVEKKNIITIKSSDYTSVMDALYMLKSGDTKMARYNPLLFLTTMSYADSKEWISRALQEYKSTIYKAGEPKTWPIQRCLKVYEARKERKLKRRTGNVG